MKKNLLLIVVVLATACLISCGGGNKKIAEVKLIPVKSGNDFQYIDQEGKIVINPQFSAATVFRNGLALVENTGDNPKWGYISEDGKYSISATYKQATVFSEDLAWVVTENAPPTAINNKGELKITLTEAETVKIFKDGLAAFCVVDTSGQKWGFVDKEGKIKITPQFKNTGYFSNGKCAVANKDGKWGYIDKDGKIFINYQFELAKEFNNEKAVVKLGEKTGVIDVNGKYMINPQFSDMKSDGDLFMVEQDNKWGWCDNEGKTMINPQFEEAFPFQGNNLAAVLSGKSWGYVDQKGKIQINPQFDVALPFNGKLALVVSSKKVGFIDIDGKYVINPQFDDVSEDLVDYMLNGTSKYESVGTDFFNMGAIIGRLKKDIKPASMAGITFDTPLSKTMEIFKKKDEDFNLYANAFALISNEVITKDISIDFYYWGTVAKAERVGSGWNVQNKYVLDKNALPVAMGFFIKLSGKGIGKEKDVIKEIEKIFTFLEKEPSSTDELIVFKMKNGLIAKISIVKDNPHFITVYYAKKNAE